MNRTVIFEKDGNTFIQTERLPLRPSGSGSDRRKALKSGWKPDWVKAGQPTKLDGPIKVHYTAIQGFFSEQICIVPPGSDKEIEIQAHTNEMTTVLALNAANTIVSQIKEYIRTFQVDPPQPSRYVLIDTTEKCGYCSEPLFGGNRCSHCGGV